MHAFTWFQRIKNLSCVAGLAWLIFWMPTTTVPAWAEDSTPLRVKPVAERTIGIKPYETQSTSPWGGSRWGGTDERTFAFSPDGKLLATQDAGIWQLELWDVDSGKSLGRFGRIEDRAALAFSPDGRTLVTAGSSHHNPCAVELWDVARRQRLRGLDEGVNLTTFTAVAFTPDGKTLALAGGFRRHSSPAPAVHLWDVASGDEIRRIEGLVPAAVPDRNRWPFQHFDALTFSPDGRCLAMVSDHRVLLVELATGKERCLLGVLPPAYGRGEKFTNRAPAIAFAPDGRTLAVACSDSVIRLWDGVTGAELRPLTGHAGAVVAVRFSADGKSLLSFGRDNKALTWSVADVRRDWPPRRENLPPKVLDALWNDLYGKDQPTLEEAIHRLAASPDSSLPLLRERLKPVPAVDSQRVAELVAGLSKEEFNERKKAAIELRKLGDLALPALRQAEAKNRIELIRSFREQLESQYPTREQVQAFRALQVLERIGNDEARRLLEELAKGASESLFTQQAQAALQRLSKEAGLPIGEARLETLWADLAHEDARRAFRALRALAARPKEAVPFLTAQLRPAAVREASDDPQRIAQLIADLDSEQFATREAATRELAHLGRRAEASLRKTLEALPSVEVRKRVEALLQEMARPTVSPEQLQLDRSLEALEWIGTGEVRQALDKLGREARNRPVKDAVTASLQRLSK